jgi:hypothetical protein
MASVVLLEDLAETDTYSTEPHMVVGVVGAVLLLLLLMLDQLVLHTAAMAAAVEAEVKGQAEMVHQIPEVEVVVAVQAEH